ncbi:FRG domain-containing protein [Cellulophaga sp. Z1A5H]|uniref:FRG domain-containing protein n=1 Tax=Cellulophaga sp. Z1A5H TaxID=2687291 RepID=UPI0013FD8725|nr:FRG domain-containing protein [Cellulophaga sp. Z1A5H]
MKTYDSEVYGKIPEPQSFNELIEIITDTETDDHDEKYKFVPVRFWRGQPDITWKIDSSAYRRIISSTKSIDYNGELLYYEKSLLEQATHKGFRLQNGRELTDMELLARLQHHGAATRLVDFSRNSLIGLWFAINNPTEKTGILIGVHSHYVGGNESKLELNNYSDTIAMIKDKTYPSLWESPEISPRIASQHALFLYSNVSSDNYGSLKLPEGAKANIFIAINPKLKQQLKEILSQVFDIRTKTLFPDLDGFGMANSFNMHLNEMWRW